MIIKAVQKTKKVFLRALLVKPHHLKRMCTLYSYTLAIDLIFLGNQLMAPVLSIEERVRIAARYEV